MRIIKYYFHSKKKYEKKIVQNSRWVVVVVNSENQKQINRGYLFSINGELVQFEYYYNNR